MKTLILSLLVFIFCHFTAFAQDFIELCRGINYGPDTVLVRSGAGSDFSRISTIEVAEEFDYISEVADGQGQIWARIEKSDWTEGYVASWLITKTDCVSVQVLATSGENCVTLYRYGNLIFEAFGLNRYADELTVNQIVAFADLVDQHADTSYTNIEIILYFIPNPTEGHRLFPGVWQDGWYGVNGNVSFNGCTLEPSGNGQLVNVIVVRDDDFVLATIVHEFSHAMGGIHGSFETNADPSSLSRFEDAYYWSYVASVSIHQGCDRLFEFKTLSENDNEICLNIRQIAGL